MSDRRYAKVEKTGQIISPVPATEILGEIYDILEERGKKFLTRNSKCPCGSGVRFKRCHGKSVKFT
jgi:uncharacterized protein YecA (UPF0149 family)